MKYRLKTTTKFDKDVKLAIKQGKDMKKLGTIVALLQDCKPLPAKNRDHKLTNCQPGTRECHIEPDWLLIYRIDEAITLLELIRTGSHSRLFNK